MIFLLWFYVLVSRYIAGSVFEFIGV